ncbi:MAG TPA: F0F1 ATP synthase subunit A [Candidatus Dormibacteraeota bacterium]
MSPIYLAAFEPPPVTHPTVNFCAGPDILCQVDYLSLIASLVSIVVTIAFVLWVASKAESRKPGKLQMVFELVFGYARQQIRDSLGEDPPAFLLPLALTIFFYILIANWIDFLPIPHPYAPANTDLNQTAAMALVVFVLAQGYSIRVRGFGGYLHHLTRPFELPIWARILFVPLNVIEELAKPLTLSLRLFGNIFGGIVMLWVLTALLTAIPLGPVPYVVSVILVAAWKLFDVLLIGTIQAFIFFLLTIIYFGMAREGVDEEHHGGARQHAPATT